MNFIDLHEDLSYAFSKMDVINGPSSTNISDLRQLGSGIVFSVIFPHVDYINEGSNKLISKQSPSIISPVPHLSTLLEQIKLYDYISKKENIDIITSRVEQKFQGIGFLLALEGCDVLTEPADIVFLKKLGIRSIGLTWNYDTKFAASCMSSKDYGLTGSGEQIVEMCNEQNIIIDLAHSSKQTILDVCSISKRPVLCSHANVKALRDHKRNLDDQSIEAIVNTGGVIGITSIPPTLGDEPTIEDIAKHARYIGENYGWDHIALGTDFPAIEKPPKGFENIRDARNLVSYLGEQTEGVLWKNALNLINKVL